VSLIGKESEKALRGFLHEDSSLATEIANRCGAAQLEQMLAAGTSSSDESSADFDAHGDSDVGLHAVVQDELGIGIDYPPSANTSRSTTLEGGALTMMSADDSEDIWAYTDDGRRWDGLGELSDLTDLREE
jgi:hypothetical protein